MLPLVLVHLLRLAGGPINIVIQKARGWQQRLCTVSVRMGSVFLPACELPPHGAVQDRAKPLQLPAVKFGVGTIILCKQRGSGAIVDEIV